MTPEYDSRLPCATARAAERGVTWPIREALSELETLRPSVCGGAVVALSGVSLYLHVTVQAAEPLRFPETLAGVMVALPMTTLVGGSLRQGLAQPLSAPLFCRCGAWLPGGE